MYRVQPADWCDDSFEEVCEGLTAFDDENDYQLDPGNTIKLRDFILGVGFCSFLTALDTNTERVAHRKAQEDRICHYRAYRRDMGMQALHRWVDDSRPYDEDEFATFENPETPMRYREWLQLTDNQQESEVDPPAVALSRPGPSAAFWTTAPTSTGSSTTSNAKSTRLNNPASAASPPTTIICASIPSWPTATPTCFKSPMDPQ